jgi:hypothetical protein
VSDENKDKHKQFNLFIDGQEFHTDQESVTGAFIKELGKIPAGYQLFLEEEGDTPDRPISDPEGINLKGKTKHFFAVPPATFGV